MEDLENSYYIKNQLRILYSQSAVTFIFPIFFALILCYFLWDISDRTILLGWTSIIIVYSLSRYILIWRYNSVKISIANVQFWLNLFTANALISGALWSLAAILLVPYGKINLIEFTLYNSFVILTICGQVAGAVVAYSISYRVILAYAIPALLPPALFMVTMGDQYNSALGGFVLLFLLFIIASSFRLNRQFKNYVDIEYQRQKLLIENKKFIEKIKSLKETNKSLQTQLDMTRN